MTEAVAVAAVAAPAVHQAERATGESSARCVAEGHTAVGTTVVVVAVAVADRSRAAALTAAALPSFQRGECDIWGKRFCWR